MIANHPNIKTLPTQVRVNTGISNQNKAAKENETKIKREGEIKRVKLKILLFVI